MVPSGVIFAVVVLCAALFIDRLIGDPRSSYHPVALLGRFIGWWGRPEHYPDWIQHASGIFFWFVTAGLFVLPIYIFGIILPWYVYLLAAPFILKICFAWRSLEEHAESVIEALDTGLQNGRERVKMLVSRETAELDREHVLSAAYESMTENLTDSIISPLFYFCLFGLGGVVFGLIGAAFFRAANTMDAMLGYRDERLLLGWFAARMDDILNYIPARITVVGLLFYFAKHGRARKAVTVLLRDGKKRPGFNGGVVMAVMAGGTGVRFEKPGVYTIGDGERTLDQAGPDILLATRMVALTFVILAGGTLILLGSWINSMGI